MASLSKSESMLLSRPAPVSLFLAKIADVALTFNDIALVLMILYLS